MRVPRSDRLFEAGNCVRVVPGKFFSNAAGATEFVERDSKEPSGKAGGPPKRAKFLPGLEKRFLRQIIGQMRITMGHARQEGAHRRLIATHQFAECVVVLVRQNASDQVCVRKGHALLRRLLVPDFVSDKPGHYHGQTNKDRDQPKLAEPSVYTEQHYSRAESNQDQSVAKVMDSATPQIRAVCQRGPAREQF